MITPGYEYNLISTAYACSLAALQAVGGHLATIVLEASDLNRLYDGMAGRQEGRMPFLMPLNGIWQREKAHDRAKWGRRRLLSDSLELCFQAPDVSAVRSAWRWSLPLLVAFYDDASLANESEGAPAAGLRRLALVSVHPAGATSPAPDRPGGDQVGHCQLFERHAPRARRLGLATTLRAPAPTHMLIKQPRLFSNAGVVGVPVLVAWARNKYIATLRIHGFLFVRLLWLSLVGVLGADVSPLLMTGLVKIHGGVS